MLDSFTTTPDAVVGQKIFNEKFDQGTGTPAVIIVNEAKAGQVIAAAQKVEGVASGDGAVCLQPDYAKLAQLAKQLAEAKAQQKGAAGKPVRGLISICAAGGQGVAAILEA